MPVSVGAEMRPLKQEEFKELAYEVMRCVFAIHNELGRFFEEKIYQRELAVRLREARAAVPVEVSFEDFRKVYYLDLLVAGGAIFELKTVEALNHRHRGQLLNYLYLVGQEHGKLINLRSERVEHEFVNTTVTHQERTAFGATDGQWQDIGGVRLKEAMLAALHDWGTGLDFSLYEEAATHFSGRDEEPLAEVEIRIGDRPAGSQPIRMVASQVAMRITAVSADDYSDFESHLRRFLQHTSLAAIQWINITRSAVQFQTVRR